MTQDELQAKCLEWQKRLRLQDWRVTARFVRRTEFGNTHQSGRCGFSLNFKSATISVLDPIDYDGSSSSACPDDAEETLVHELLHLHAAPFRATEEDSPDDIAQEQAINCISEALVKLARGEG